MPQLLLCGWRRLSVLLALLALAAGPARASHLLGGEMTYRYLDANGPASAPFRYEITVTSYYNPNGQVGLNDASVLSVTISLFNRTTGALLDRLNVPRQTPVGAVVQPKLPAGCAIQGPSQPFRLFKYIATVALPATLDGYYAVCSQTARNVTLTNVSNPQNGNGGNVPMTLYVSMAPPLITNRSPIFSDTAVAIVCTNDTTVVLNNAVDPDGDRLIYSFGTPYGALTNGSSFPPLPNPVPYNAGFSSARPFGPGAGNFASINASTGTTKYGATTQGQYVVAVDVSEYRTINGREVLLGTTRRDLQLIVATCPATVAPVLPPVAVTPRTYSLEEGRSLSIPIRATQADGHPLVMTLNSVLLDGPGGFNATFNGNAGTVVAGNPSGTATATGAGAVASTFIYNSACGEARATPYDVALTVKDAGCAGKTVADVIRITVTRPPGPTSISGDALVCALNTVSSYSARGGSAPGVRWRVLGGTIVGANTANPVQVRWTSAGPGTVIAKGISAAGCLTDSVSQAVAVAPAGTLAVSGVASVCLGGSTSLGVSGGTAPYTLTGGGLTLTGAGPFVVTPTQTTTYTITSATTTQGCLGSTQTTVTVLPLPVANVGAATATCSGVAGPLGAAPVAGYSYLWSPATGLSNPTSANPTITLVNTTGAPVVTTYTLTVTNSATGCVGTGSIAVTVNPAAVAPPNATLSVCAGSALPLGTAPVAGYSYAWSPATGLSNPAIANPILTLANATGAPLTTTYTLTVSTAQGCVATSTTTVTVNPLPTIAPGAAVALCAGSTEQLGAPPVAGVTYLWSPATGLSNPASANPTVTLVNTTGAPVVVTYTLTATSALGCVSTGTVVVTVQPAPVVGAGPARALCAGQSTALGTPGRAGYTYAWTPAAGLSSATAAQPAYLAANATTAPVVVKFRVTATSPLGCAARDSVLVTVNPLPPTRTITGPSFVCDPSQAFTGTYTLAGAPSTSTYQWSATGGTVLSGQGTAQVRVGFTSGAASRGLSVVETAAFGCPGTSATTLNILLDQPTVDLRVASVDAASNGRVLLTFSVPNGQNTPNPVRVLRRDAGSAGAFAQVGTVAATATTYADAPAQAAQTAYEYSLSLTNGCGDVVTAPIAATTVLLKATATPGRGGRDQGTVALSWSSYQGFPVAGYRLYRQDDKGGYQLVTMLSASTFQYGFTNTGQGFNQCFRVVAFSAEATPRESNSNSACVDFANQTAFYNIITPNNDGQNDKLEIDNVQLYPGNTMTIFNRWGREVFSTTNYNNQRNFWGTDPAIAPGIYYYLFKLPDGTATKGWVEVVK